MVVFTLSCLCLPSSVFVSLPHTLVLCFLSVCPLCTLSTAGMPSWLCTCCCVHIDQVHLRYTCSLVPFLSLSLRACSLCPMYSRAFLQSFVCLLLCLGLALSSACCASVPLYLACSESVFLSLLSFCLSLPPAPSCSLYLQHVSICSCRFRKSTWDLYVLLCRS